ncbi:MAG: prepilin-type N-terminal cleavage/methylation domain-containing protein [Candidatus Pacebacteria bacterium]|jgi:prepilin-type N-terminal cleavage/methylation domain-containing protein|nr:prepilin-type N-terminal cleavage/methylation domain-containing protein [Candidatus Paceibacterota bacterium]|tara:strand:- start:20183 stop:21649 length:1467 start_codon:yes stop_codon:yes gene_type:complete
MRDDFFKIEKPLNEGFSLIETLVAITVLLIAVTGPLSIAHRALSDANLAKNQTIAIFLAQDAIEYLKNLRDENLLSGNDWDRTINDCNGTCIVDSALDTLTACSGSCPVLRQDSATGLYGYNNNWEPTLFTRTVTTTTVNEDEFSVSVDISWQNGTITKTISLKEHILNWHESMAPLTTGLIHLQTPVSTFEATGGTITTSGRYTIHTFTNDNNTGYETDGNQANAHSTDTFTPNGSGNVEVLVIGGGGSGGNSGGSNSTTAGGGGAGGFVEKASHAVTAQAYTVYVGAGGPIGTGAYSDRNGGNSSFDGITAIGGGGGMEGNAGRDGGSGGASSYNVSGGGTGTQGNSNGGTGYGNNGGEMYNSVSPNIKANGGGGGAGAVGGNGSSSSSGDGGIGRQSSITGSAVYYAGGGGGGGVSWGSTSAGSGGNGGGGAGGSSGSPQGSNGTHDTGGGGGGSANYNPPSDHSDGGSGIVIIRYVTATGVNSL